MALVKMNTKLWEAERTGHPLGAKANARCLRDCLGNSTIQNMFSGEASLQ
jgi:hypothetical protein